MVSSPEAGLLNEVLFYRQNCSSTKSPKSMSLESSWKDIWDQKIQRTRSQAERKKPLLVMVSHAFCIPLSSPGLQHRSPKSALFPRTFPGRVCSSKRACPCIFIASKANTQRITSLQVANDRYHWRKSHFYGDCWQQFQE